jgi:hypothetical protein
MDSIEPNYHEIDFYDILRCMNSQVSIFVMRAMDLWSFVIAAELFSDNGWCGVRLNYLCEPLLGIHTRCYSCGRA